MQPQGSQTWQAQRLRRNWYLLVSGLLAVLAGVWLLRSGEDHLRVGGGLLAWMGIWFTIGAFFRNAGPLRYATHLRIDEHHLYLGEEAIPRGQITSAKIIPREKDSALVRLALASRGVLLSMRRQDAWNLLDRLGFGAGQRRTQFAVFKPFQERYLAGFLLSTSILGLLAAPFRRADLLLGAVFYGLLSGVFVAWLQRFVRGWMELGADGITLRWYWPWKTRYLSFRETKKIELFRSSDGFWNKLHLVGGETIEIYSPYSPVDDDDRGSEAQALFEHIRAALHQFQQRQSNKADLPDLPSLLGRNGRDARAWHQSLASLAQSSAYRSGHASPDLLASAVTDADLPPDVRAGAAVALLRAPSPEGRKAVRVAIEACADPDLLATLQELEEASSQPQQEAALRRLAR